MRTTSKSFRKSVSATLGAFLLIISLTSCDIFNADPKPLVFETGPVVFLRHTGVIESFHIVIDDLGSKQIEEYGVAYAFDSTEIINEPIITDKKVVFEDPIKVGGTTQAVKIDYPVSTTCISCRAYAKFKDGSVQYAMSQKMLF